MLLVRSVSWRVLACVSWCIPPFASLRTGLGAEREGGPVGGETGAGVTHVVTVCRLVEKKGVDTLVRALGCLHGSEPGRWRLTIAGDGPLRGDAGRVTTR